MKRIIVLIISLILLTACTSKEENKIAYLEYKNDLEKQDVFTDEDKLDFSVYFNIIRESEEITNYSILINNPIKIINKVLYTNYSVLINNPKINMYNVKALLIHDYVIDDAFPSVGIFDTPMELLVNSGDKLELSGKIQTIDDISNIKYKLYIEYIDDNGNENKIYYDVKRG